ncbi:MAG: 1,4-dihydroxy-2-naphthoate octaprenyltransferase [Bacteroides sp.]|nr:1,4-dihydroxy-2-naphthoate octaprenyltransferase [Bacteroides sp.]
MNNNEQDNTKYDRHGDGGGHASHTKAWIEAMRLRTLPVSVAGVIAGCGCAAYYGGFNILPGLICLLFAIVAQVASNFANEYYDYANGLDKKGREGFRRGVTEGDISPKAMKRATYILLAIDALLGCSLIWWGGWWLIAVGIAVLLFALAYSTGPYPLSHHGLGDITVVIFFGVVPVMLTAWLQTGSWDILPLALPLSVGTGMLAANVLIVNNYRDMEDDEKVGKHTTVVMFGRPAMLTVYMTMGIVGTFLPYPVLIAGGTVNAWWLLLPLWGSVGYFLLGRSISRLRGAALNPMLKHTAMLMLVYTVLNAVMMSIC